MVDYTNVIYSGVSIIVEIAIGFVCFKAKVFSEASISNLNNFLVNICYLPLIFRAIAVRDLKTLSFMPFVVAIVSVTALAILMLVVFLIRGFKNNFYMYLSTLLPVAYVNYLIIGLPIFKSMWGESENAMVAVQNLSGDLFVVPIYLILTNFYRIYLNNIEHKQNGDGIVEHASFKIVKDVLIRLVTNKFIIGNALGFIYAGTGWKMCPFIGLVMKYLGDAVLALALFTVGGFLAQHSLIACNWLHFIVSILLRMVAFPWLIAFFCYIFKVSSRLSRQCMVMGSMPSATASFFFSYQFGTGPGVASTMILWSTVLSVPASILWLYVLDKCKIFIE